MRQRAVAQLVEAAAEAFHPLIALPVFLQSCGRGHDSAIFLLPLCVFVGKMPDHIGHVGCLLFFRACGQAVDDIAREECKDDHDGDDRNRDGKIHSPIVCHV
ncbi:hypothetical protein SDC9_126476 [bioreactor metagenome]|uniref:Uncharacterized protein n=1 Tax=bioreactor metagenome TaxID=1076179 RepID=A0A645CRA0_9ZZZZ